MNIKDILPIYIILLLSNLGVSVVIPILSDLDKNYGLTGLYIISKDLIISIGSIEAVFVFISTLSLLFWGYHVDKNNRRRLFFISLTIFILGNLIILVQTKNVLFYIVGRCLFMGTGLGALGPAAYSYAGDVLSYEKRSTINSTLSIIGIGGIGIGIVGSGLLSRIYLFLPFIVLIVLGLLLMIILYIYPEPIRGSEEPEIKTILQRNSTTKVKVKEIETSYSQNISLNSVKILLSRKTNVYVLIQGFFALFPSIIFSYYLISYLHDTRYGGSGLNLTFALIIGMGAASGRLFGFPIFGWLGDKLHFSSHGYFKSKGRALVALVTMVLEAPIFIISFLIVLPSLAGQPQIFPNLFFQHMQFILFGLLFFIGAFIGGGSGPNRNSIMFDVNEPELRGQTSSILAIGDQFGASFGLILGNILIVAYGYSIAFAILSLGYLISGIFWIGAYFSIEEDEMQLRDKISQRMTVINKPLEI